MIKPKYRVYHYPPWGKFPEQYDYALITKENKEIIDRTMVLKNAKELLYTRFHKTKWKCVTYRSIKNGLISK